MFKITFPDNTTGIIDKIREAIGREITIHTTVTGIACSTCTLDPVTNLSTDPFCSTCEGDYWMSTVSDWTCSAHVRWIDAKQMLWAAGGKIYEGDCVVTIKYTESGYDVVKNSKSFTVDGEELYMKNLALRGVPEINRIRITLLEDPG